MNLQQINNMQITNICNTTVKYIYTSLRILGNILILLQLLIKYINSTIQSSPSIRVTTQILGIFIYYPIQYNKLFLYKVFQLSSFPFNSLLKIRVVQRARNL